MAYMHRLGWYDASAHLPISDDPVIVDIAETECPTMLICWIGDPVNGVRERSWVYSTDYSELPSHYTVLRWMYFDFNDEDFKIKESL